MEWVCTIAPASVAAYTARCSGVSDDGRTPSGSSAVTAPSARRTGTHRAGSPSARREPRGVISISSSSRTLRLPAVPTTSPPSAMARPAAASAARASVASILLLDRPERLVGGLERPVDRLVVVRGADEPVVGGVQVDAVAPALARPRRRAIELLVAREGQERQLRRAGDVDLEAVCARLL